MGDGYPLARSRLPGRAVFGGRLALSCCVAVLAAAPAGSLSLGGSKTPCRDPLTATPLAREGSSDSLEAFDRLERAVGFTADAGSELVVGATTLAPCFFASATEDVADTSIGLTGGAAPKTSGAFHGRLSLTA